MPFSSLPTELWQAIGSDSTVGSQEHYSLILVNKHFYDIFLPFLYRGITITGKSYRGADESPSLENGPQRAMLTEQSCLLLEQLASERLRGYVQQFNIYHVELQWTVRHILEPIISQVMRSMVNILVQMPNLKTLSLYSVRMQASDFFLALSQPNQQLAVHIHQCRFWDSGEALDVEPLTFTRFSLISGAFADSVIPIRATLGKSLKHLTLSHTPKEVIIRLLKAHMDLGTETLPNLESLNIAWIDRQHFPFFQCTPRLKSLEIQTAEKLDVGADPLMKKAAPELQTLKMHNSLLKVFTKGRPITTISTRDSTGSSPWMWDHDDNISLDGLGRFFGAAANVQNVVWENCTRNQDLLRYLVKHNPRITCLELKPTLGYSREELHDRLEILKDLKELQTLTVKCLHHVPNESSLEWERQQCEWMRKEGCLSLAFVSFSILVDWHYVEWVSNWVPSGRGLLVRDLYKGGRLPTIVSDI